MRQATLIQLKGLRIQANALTVPPGSLETARNALVSQDSTITKPRGLSLWQYLPENSRGLFEYRGTVFAAGTTRLFRLSATPITGTATSTSGSANLTVTATAHGLASGNRVTMFDVAASQTAFQAAYPNRRADFYGEHAVAVTNANEFAFTADAAATATVTTAAATTSFYSYQTQGGVQTSWNLIPCRAVNASKNAYFTSDNGIYKIESLTAGMVLAGIAPGLDLQGDLTGRTGPILPNAQVGYRVVFGRKDANSNLVLGAPGEALTLTNNVKTISAINIVYDPATNIVTITDTAHGLFVGNTVFLFGVVSIPAGRVVDGTALQVKTVPTANTFTIDLDDAGITALTAPGITGLKYGLGKTTDLSFTVPSDLLSTSTLYQIYRTSLSGSANVSPEQNYRLLEEANLTAAQVTAGFVSYQDTTEAALIEGEAQLYTNPAVEGEFQANSRPPKATDIALFKDYVFYAAVTDYASLALSLVAPDSIVSGTSVTIGTRVYTFVGNASNQPVGNRVVTDSASTLGYVEVYHTAHGFSVGDTIYVSSVAVISGISPGIYTILAGSTADLFRFGSGASAAGTVTYEGVAQSGGSRLVTLSVSSASVSVSQAIQQTTSALIKAINRDPSSTVYAQSVTTADSPPGRMFLQAKALTTPFVTITASAANTGAAFFPVVPTSGTAVQLVQSATGNALRVSKVLEPEAVPVVNEYPIGSANFPILRILPLRDSLIVLKGDGVFRLNGDSTSNFQATALDTTVLCKASSSAVVLNNSVYCLSNQGFVQITDSNVRVVSRNIELPIAAIVGKPTLEQATAAAAYESERLYLCSTLGQNDSGTAPTITYAYNYVTDEWTTWERTRVFFAQSIVTLADQLVLASQNGPIYLERKSQTKLDWADQEYATVARIGQPGTAQTTVGSQTVVITGAMAHGIVVGQAVTLSETGSAGNLPNAVYTAVSADTDFQFMVNVSPPAASTASFQVVFTSLGVQTAKTTLALTTPLLVSPQVGDMLVSGSAIYPLTAVSQLAGNRYAVTSSQAFSPLVTATTNLFESISTFLKFAPITGGNVGMLKYHSEFQTSFRNSESCSALTLYFGSDSRAGTDPVMWVNRLGTGRQPVISGGWGTLPWGEFPWGGGVSINRLLTTSPAPPLRVYVPKGAFLGTFLQPTMQHSAAGEPLELQSISIYTQPVSQRTTR